MCVLVRTSTAAIKGHDQKLPGEERVYYVLQLLGHTLSLREVREETEGRILQAGTEAEALRSIAYRLAPMVCSATFVYNSGPPAQKGQWALPTHSDLGLPTTRTIPPQASLIRDTVSVKFPSFPCPAPCQVDINQAANWTNKNFGIGKI